MSKKKKDRIKRRQGMYAMCITTGLVVGIGLGPAFDSVILSTLIGVGLGTVAAYLITRS